MTVSKNDKHKEYAHYAAHCLEMVPSVPDQDFFGRSTPNGGGMAKAR
jgi:hypothetical protein